MAMFDDRALVHCQPVVVLHVCEVDQPGDISADTPVLAGNFDWNALDQVAVETSVFLDKQRSLGLLHLTQYFLQGFGGQVRIEAFKCLLETCDQQHLFVADAFGCRTIRRDVRPVQYGIAELGEPFESGVLDMTFPRISYHGLYGPSRLRGDGFRLT